MCIFPVGMQVVVLLIVVLGILIVVIVVLIVAVVIFAVVAAKLFKNINLLKLYHHDKRKWKHTTH